MRKTDHSGAGTQTAYFLKTILRKKNAVWQLSVDLCVRFVFVCFLLELSRETA